MKIIKFTQDQIKQAIEAGIRENLSDYDIHAPWGLVDLEVRIVKQPDGSIQAEIEIKD